jgi:hypothetical protein
VVNYDSQPFTFARSGPFKHLEIAFRVTTGKDWRRPMKRLIASGLVSLSLIK